MLCLTPLSFLSHINSLSKLEFFHLRQIVQLRPFISINDAETLIQAFVSSRLDYCNALFTGLPATSIARLQYIQNSAARILTRTKRSAHITPILADLHWLSVAYRIKFKMILLIFKALTGLAPYYLWNLLLPYSPLFSSSFITVLRSSPSLGIASLPWVADLSVLLPLNYGTLYQDHSGLACRNSNRSSILTCF